MRVLLVENDKQTSHHLETSFQESSVNVYATDLGEEALDLAKTYDYDLIILSDNITDMNALDVLKNMRRAKIPTPLLFLSGDERTDTKLSAFGLGADDFMTKPFHKKELVARAHAIVRRSKGHAEPVIKTGNIEVNLDRKTCRIDDIPVHLTGKEYQMLELMSLRKGSCITKEMFLNHLYGGMDEPELKIIDVFICKLRKKLRNGNANSDEFPGRHFIETIWGRGYVLSDEAGAPSVKTLYHKAADPNNAYAPPPSYTDAKVHEEMSILREQVATMQEMMGLAAGASMAEAMEKLQTYVRQAEAQLEDDIEANPSIGTELVVSDTAKDFGSSSRKTMPGFENGVRLPIGTTFGIGSLIQIDTSENLAANTNTSREIPITPVVGALLEILSYFKGKEINKKDLISYLFENPNKASEAKLGMYMSQAQGALTQLVGRGLASSIIQILSGGGYGMPEMPTLLTSTAPNQNPINTPRTGMPK